MTFNKNQQYLSYLITPCIYPFVKTLKEIYYLLSNPLLYTFCIIVEFVQSKSIKQALLSQFCKLQQFPIATFNTIKTTFDLRRVSILTAFTTVLPLLQYHATLRTTNIMLRHK